MNYIALLDVVNATYSKGRPQVQGTYLAAVSGIVCGHSNVWSKTKSVVYKGPIAGQAVRHSPHDLCWCPTFHFARRLVPYFTRRNM